METQETKSSTKQLPCKYLRHKAMFYEEPGQDEREDSASRVYWCARTQEAFGPDGEAAERVDCCPGRSCYVR